MMRLRIVWWLAGLSLAACAGGGAPAVDGGGPDAGALDASPDPPDASVELGEPEVYGDDVTLSPITPYVAHNLRDIAARSELQGDVFAKVGDDSTVSSSFVHCLDGAAVDLAGLEDAEQLDAAIAHFRDGDAAGSDPFQRASGAAAVGWHAASVLDGPLDAEYAAIAPRFAVILFGTYDIDDRTYYEYGADLLEITDRSIAAGVIPILTAAMARGDSAAADADVPRFNAVARAVAQARQVPFVDLHRELDPISGRGLGADGVHLSVYQDAGQPRPCTFDAAGLGHGYNVRNLLTLRMLARAMSVVVDNRSAPDASRRSLRGAGTSADPFVVGALPFGHFADTRSQGSREIDLYDGCAAAQDESGRELFYRLDVDQTTAIRAMLVDWGGTDVDVHLLAGSPTGEGCVARNHRVITAVLDPGTYYFSLDTFVSQASGELAGEYLFVVVEDTGG